MRLYVIPALILTSFFVFSCATTGPGLNIPSGVGEAVMNSRPLTEAEVSGGLKEALTVGISKGANTASQPDGYYKNSLIRIAFPPDVQKVENRLRAIGMGKLVDDFVLSLNRAAEDAAQSAKPIFISAIKSLTIKDVWGILTGGRDAATQYLKRTTSDQLTAAFTPQIKASLEKVEATKYYGELIGNYNQLPLVQKVNPDLTGYATQKAIDGLFILVAEEEANIRENPIARTTQLLRRVFARQDKG